MSSGIRPVCITVPLETMQRIASALEIAAEPVLVRVVDDPHKDRKEAESPTYRQRVKDWWDAVFYTRREPGAVIIVSARELRLELEDHVERLRPRPSREAP
jgi:hypothetical protein